MAATKLDALWDKTMPTLTKSYIATIDALEAGKIADASNEFKTNFAPAVKTLYVDIAQTYPPRYEGLEDWCTWSRNFYAYTHKANNLLAEGKTDDAKTHLEALRAQFYKMHLDTKKLTVSDYIFLFRTMAAAKELNAANLKAYLLALDVAPAPVGVKMDEYTKARSAWSASVSPLLDDTQIAPDEVAPLREAAEKFYKAFGRRFE